jgi:hypothetical protein
VRLRSGKGLEMATFLLVVQAPTDVPALGPSRSDPARETGGHRNRPRSSHAERADRLLIKAADAVRLLGAHLGQCARMPLEDSPARQPGPSGRLKKAAPAVLWLINLPLRALRNTGRGKRISTNKALPRHWASKSEPSRRPERCALGVAAHHVRHRRALPSLRASADPLMGAPPWL